jgi:hypothetical protein
MLGRRVDDRDWRVQTEVHRERSPAIECEDLSAADDPAFFKCSFPGQANDRIVTLAAETGQIIVSSSEYSACPATSVGNPVGGPTDAQD